MSPESYNRDGCFVLLLHLHMPNPGQVNGRRSIIIFIMEEAKKGIDLKLQGITGQATSSPQSFWSVFPNTPLWKMLNKPSGLPPTLLPTSLRDNGEYCYIYYCCFLKLSPGRQVHTKKSECS